ncbi:MAG: hypothetical protein ACKV0T_03160 [Planctomycetales bacterium]
MHRIVLLLLLAGWGCGGNSEKSYIPSDDAARSALQAALGAWQGGQAKPGAITTAKPTVQVSDPVWEAGTKLSSFEIKPLEGESPRRFSVKLVLEGAADSQEVVYVVFGKDPLWVVREEEFNRDGGM